MANGFDKFAFETAHMARIGWYFGQKMLAARLARPNPAPEALRGRTTPDRRRLLADLWRLIERDWHNIETGVYAMPEDWPGRPLTEWRHAVDFFGDLAAVETRRHGAPGNLLIDTPEAQSYPAYYRRMFHFQSDGYLSAASAERYDHQVEVLFGGGAAPMRRQALVPLRNALRQVDGGARTARLLDIGCGTGAFLREVKRNWPRLSVSGLDLSGPYLELTRRALKDWSRVSVIKAAAETMPFDAGQFDVVTCIYLFHELPASVRRLVVDEIRRVLKPGGTLILVDSLQTGDEPEYDALLDYFPFAFHEPYYASYLVEDLDRLMRPGFSPEERSLAYFSKVVAYRCGGLSPG